MKIHIEMTKEKGKPYLIYQQVVIDWNINATTTQTHTLFEYLKKWSTPLSSLFFILFSCHNQFQISNFFFVFFYYPKSSFWLPLVLIHHHQQHSKTCNVVLGFRFFFYYIHNIWWYYTYIHIEQKTLMKEKTRTSGLYDVCL